MRIVKIFILIVIVIGLSMLLYENQELNPDPLIIWLWPGMIKAVLLPILIALTLLAGVFVGFLIALTQIVAQKSEARALRNNVKKLQGELDELRNQAISDVSDIVIRDTTENVEL